MTKKTLGVLFGGQSAEHEVSCMSVQNVVNCIDTDKYEIILIGITKEGRWLKVDSPEDIITGKWTQGTIGAIISPDATEKCLILDDGKNITKKKLDAVFPVIHGGTGEDGKLQGLLELAGIPYVGCGVLSSAVTMDKYFTKIIVDKLGGIRQADYVLILTRKLGRKMEEYCDQVEKKFRYPVFVKPCNGGSSCGVSRADNRAELKAGILEAAKFDSKILVEEFIEGREIECAVLGRGDEVYATGIGEIISAAAFYDYDAKYNNPDSQTLLNPQMEEDIIAAIRDASVQIFKAVEGAGLSRVDFRVQPDGTVVFNEINTMPGFTNISMYPMLWEAKGLSKKELVQKLIDLADTDMNSIGKL